MLALIYFVYITVIYYFPIVFLLVLVFFINYFLYYEMYIVTINYYMNLMINILFLFRVKICSCIHAVSRQQQDRQREPSVKTLRSPFSAELSGHCVLNGGAQRRALPRTLYPRTKK